MRNKIIFGILKLITTTLLTLSILTMIAYKDLLFAEPEDFLSGGEPYSFSTYDLDSYNEFIKTEPSIPTNYISANDVKSFGTFECFRYGLDDQEGTPQYVYYFEFQNGIDISLYISHHGGGTSWDTPISNLKLGSSMLELKTEDSGFILSNGLEYHYSCGKLSSINWRANGVDFHLTVHISEETPIVDTNTTLGKLLSKSTILQWITMRELPNSIGNVGIPPTICCIILNLLPFVAFALIAALLGLIFVPRHRKEHDHPKYYANDFRNL